jgi:WD40 repeat protein
MIEHFAPISDVCSFGGQYIITAGYDNQVILWDALDNSAIGRGYHDHLANQCTISECGRYAASSSSDYSARIWELPSMRLVALVPGHTDDVEGLAFHPDRPWLATASRDNTVGIYDYRENRKWHLKGHSSDVLSVAWSEDGELLISSGDDGTIRIWDPVECALVETVDLCGVETDTIAVGDSGKVFAGNDEGEIITLEKGRISEKTKGHGAGIKRLVYDRKAKKLVSLSYDRKMKIWDTGSKLTSNQETELPDIVWPRSCAFITPSKLALVTFGHTYAVYNLEGDTWHADRIKQTPGLNAVCEHNNNVYAVGDSGVVLRDNQRVCNLATLCNFIVAAGDIILTGGQRGSLMNAATGEVYYQHGAPLNCAASNFSEGCENVYIGTYTGHLLHLVFELGVARLVNAARIHANAIKGVSVQDGIVFTVCADRTAVFSDAKTLAPLRVVENEHGKIANGCSSLGAGRFASISRDLKLRLWSYHEDTVETVDTPSTNSIKCVSASACGRYVAIGTYAGHAGIFDVKRRSWPVWKKISQRGISCSTWTQDMKFLFASYSGHVHSIAEPEQDANEKAAEIV